MKLSLKKKSFYKMNDIMWFNKGSFPSESGTNSICKKKYNTK